MPPSSGSGQPPARPTDRSRWRRVGGLPAGPLTQRLGWHALCVLVTTAFLVVMRFATPGFFWTGDRQNQYFPVMRDIGRRLLDGEFPPAIDPDLGISGNYAIDMQYGLYDPTHWLVALAVSQEPNAYTATWWWSSVFLVLFAVAVCAIALRVGTPGPWAVACGFAAATSGFTLLWLASSWIPGLVGVTWLAWWWWAITAPRANVRTLAAIAVFTFLTITGGWPTVWFIGVLLATGIGVEAWLRRDREAGTVAWLAPLGVRALASAAGAVAALVAMVPYLRASGYNQREQEVVNFASLVPNLADVLANAAPSLTGQVYSFGDQFVRHPIYFGVWFVAVLAWFVPWHRGLLRRPGFASAGLLVTLSLVFTQLPSHLWTLRWPARFLSGLHLGLAVFAAVLVAAGPLRITRRRLAGAAGTVAYCCFLSWARQPDDAEWWVGSIALLLAAAVLVLAVRQGRRLAGLAAVMTTVGLAGLVVAQNPTSVASDWGYPPVASRAPLDLPQPAMALYPDAPGSGSWFRQGVGVGFSRLTAEQRVRPGYTSVGQQYLRELIHGDGAHQFTLPGAPGSLLAVEPTTGQRWVRLLGLRGVAVWTGDQRLRSFERLSGDDWRIARRTRDFVVLEPVRPPADRGRGRVTAVVGRADVTPAAVERGRQSYRVRSDAGATLVFRDVYWPGYVATLDGTDLPVRPLDGVLVTVQVPPGADGTLTVAYRPLPRPVLVGLPAASAVLLMLACLLARRSGRHCVAGCADTRRPRR